MGSLISKAVFCPPPVSYNKKNITFLASKGGHQIPISSTIHPKPQLAILYSHGNAEDLGYIFSWCSLLSQTFEASVYAWDYQGYGVVHQSSPTEKNIFQDVCTVYNHILNDFPPDKIIIFGRSLGCAPSIYAACSFPDSLGLILESPFLTCIKTVLQTPFTFWFDMFRNETNIKNNKVKTLIIHGKEDEVVPFSHGVALYKECPQPWGHLWLEHAGHNNIDNYFRQDLFQSIKHFIHDQCLENGVVIQEFSLRKRRRGSPVHAKVIDI